ncbi:Hint domain-containing protein [Tropicibacter sp. Alg240-R139]|uniref:Hint domain-containing protein n=1 Tax=Tropicibacter sp. Alg240-R139 TaxID=2305991 RepID=UPI0013DF5C1C|nr:Hint domain-containing protein [Tropicibacter sp. Alg240-R139]
MHLKHKTAFAQFTAAPKLHPGLIAGTMVETCNGWTQVQDVIMGTKVATFDGGFRPVTQVTRQPDATTLWCVPGGTLGACSDLLMTEDQHLALTFPTCRALYGLPLVLAPVSALAGHCGIHPIQSKPAPVHRLHFAEGEILWAQTGALIHAGIDGQDSPYRKLSYGETRALLLMMSDHTYTPDLAA